MQSADAQFVTVRQQRHVRPAGHDAHLGNEIHVGEGATTQADEPLGIEPSFEIFQAVIDRVAVALDRFEVEPRANAVAPSRRAAGAALRRDFVRERDRLS